MIVVADVGATRSDWRSIEDDRITQYQTPGFNPQSYQPDQLIEVFPSELKDSSPETIHFYIAGVVNDLVKNQLNEYLKNHFESSTIEVYSDLLGTARGLFGGQEGIAGILGTGSAACYYDGVSIQKRIPSLGYLLGDEGSGFHLGKNLLAAYLRNQLPERLQEKFASSFPDLDETAVLKEVFKGKQPNKYIASFARFAVTNQSDPWIYQLVYSGFEAYFNHFLINTDWKNCPVRFSGSIAYLLSNILLKVGKDHNFVVDRVVQSPIAGLALYHQKHG